MYVSLKPAYDEGGAQRAVQRDNGESRTVRKGLLHARLRISLRDDLTAILNDKLPCQDRRRGTKTPSCGFRQEALCGCIARFPIREPIMAAVPDRAVR